MNQQKKQTCTYCGCTGHGKRAPPNVWTKECLVHYHRCRLCNRDHHTEAVCRSKENPKTLTETTNASTQEAAAFSEFSELCTLTTTDRNKGSGIALDHHLYNNLSNAWRKAPLLAQPYIPQNVSANKQNYKDLGFPTSIPADTGCQSLLTLAARAVLLGYMFSIAWV